MADHAAPVRKPAPRATKASRAAAGPGPSTPRPPWRPPVNRTGLPDRLKSGVEALSGLSMDDVRVHPNSSEPAKLGALAYAQGSDIHLGPGQERHLPHEAWHVVQQKQGRVEPRLRMMSGTTVNDDKGLELEADAMGAKVLATAAYDTPVPAASPQSAATSVQLEPDPDADAGKALLAILAQLEALSRQVQTDRAPDAAARKAALRGRMEKIAEIARSSDAALKRRVLAEVRREIGSVRGFDGAQDREVVQRQPVVQLLTGVEIAFALGAIAGLGVLVAGMCRGVQPPAPAQDDQDGPDLEQGEQPLLQPAQPQVPQAAAAQLTLDGPIHEEGWSYATVTSRAEMTDAAQHIDYYISWENDQVVPGGNHLGQQQIQPGTWVQDRSPQGDVIGDRQGPLGGYFDNPPEQNGRADPHGLYFLFPDGIAQRGPANQGLNNGRWWFRLRVRDGNATLAEHTITVNWNH